MAFKRSTETVEAPAAANAPKFKVGDAVVLDDGRKGIVTEVSAHDRHWFDNGCPQLYSVKLQEWVAEEYFDENRNVAVRYRHPDDKPGREARYRDHAVDVLGGVPEVSLSAAKGK